MKQELLMKVRVPIFLFALAAVSAAAADEPIGHAMGTELMAKYKCSSCHSMQDNPSMQGPSLRAIAHKYASAPEAKDELESVVLEGTSGDWGPNKMPPTDVPQPDLRYLVEWILAQWP
jgi:cytochrome c551/c552